MQMFSHYLKRCKRYMRRIIGSFNMMTHNPILQVQHWRVARWRSLSEEQSSFSNLSVTSLTSQLILQPLRRFTNVRAHSPTLPLLHLRYSSFSNPSFASPTSQALHWIHLASRPGSSTGAVWLVKYYASTLGLTLIVPSANSVSTLKIVVANRLIHAIHKNCIAYLFL